VRSEKLTEDSKEGVEKKNAGNKVGVEENNFGFGAGKANKDSKPTRNISNLVNIPKEEF
jgi:kinesin family protein 6/9